MSRRRWLLLLLGMVLVHVHCLAASVALFPLCGGPDACHTALPWPVWHFCTTHQCQWLAVLAERRR